MTEINYNLYYQLIMIMIIIIVKSCFLSRIHRKNNKQIYFRNPYKNKNNNLKQKRVYFKIKINMLKRKKKKFYP